VRKWKLLMLVALVLIVTFRTAVQKILFAGTVELICDGEQSRDLATMNPRLRKKVIPIIESLRQAGFDFQISSVYRSLERQKCLYSLSDRLKQVTGCCIPMSPSECATAGLSARSCAVLTTGGCTERYKRQNYLHKKNKMTFPRGRLGGLIPCMSGVTGTVKSCHSNVRNARASSLAIDLHIYGESEERTVEFYQQLRSKVRAAQLISGGDFPKTNPYWSQHGLGWDPGHIELPGCSKQLRLK